MPAYLTKGRDDHAGFCPRACTRSLHPGSARGHPPMLRHVRQGLQLRFVLLVIRWRGRPHPVPRASGLVLDRKCAEQTPSGLLRRKLGGARYNFRNQFRNRLVVRHRPSVHDVSAQQGRYPHRIVCRMVDEQLDVVAIDEVSIASANATRARSLNPAGSPLRLRPRLAR